MSVSSGIAAAVTTLEERELHTCCSLLYGQGSIPLSRRIRLRNFAVPTCGHIILAELQNRVAVGVAPRHLGNLRTTRTSR
eukprot:3363006-Pleurochrysis_carterae.AAC.2